MFTFVVLLSTNVFAAPRIFRNLGNSIMNILTAQMTIPHPNYYNPESVPFLIFIATWFLLTIVTYSLVVWEGSHLKFLSQSNKVAIIFSVALSLIAIYAAPIVEWIATLIELASSLGWIILILTVLFFAYIAVIRIFGKGAQQIGIFRNEYAETVKSIHEAKVALREAKKIPKDPDKTIKAGASRIRRFRNRLPNYKEASISDFNVALSKVLRSFPHLGDENDQRYYESNEGQELIRETRALFQELRELSINMHASSNVVEGLKDVRKKLMELDKSRKEYGFTGKEFEDLFNESISRLDNSIIHIENETKGIHGQFLPTIEKLILEFNREKSDDNLTKFLNGLMDIMQKVSKLEFYINKKLRDWSINFETQIDKLKEAIEKSEYEKAKSEEEMLDEKIKKAEEKQKKDLIKKVSLMKKKVDSIKNIFNKSLNTIKKGASIVKKAKSEEKEVSKDAEQLEKDKKAGNLGFSN